jgi:hypothetical protein
VNKFTPFSGWSLHAAEAVWLIIKNLDQDERNARGSYRTISTTIYGQQFDEGAARQRRNRLSGP